MSDPILSPEPSGASRPGLRLLFFSVLTDISGTEEILWTMDGDVMTVRDVLTAVYDRWPRLRVWDGRLLVAVDHAYASLSDVVRPGQEMALMPPVQGG